MTKFSDVPRDLIILFLAKVPIVYHSTVSLTSKTMANLLSSPELFNSRSQENIAYVCLEDVNGNLNWLTLSKKPMETTLSTGFWLTPLKLEETYTSSESMATSGRKIYMLLIEDPKDITLRLRIFDCVSKKWSVTAPMVNARNNSAVLVGINDTIWVIGGTKEKRRLSPEVYSTKNGLWSSVTEPIIENDNSVVLINRNAEDRVEIWQKTTNQAYRLTFIPEISSWEKGNSCLSKWHQESFTVAIQDFIVRISGGSLLWYNKCTMIWKFVKGLDLGDNIVHAMAQGGNLLFFSNTSDGRMTGSEISLERQGDEVLGKRVWVDAIVLAEDYGRFCSATSISL